MEQIPMASDSSDRPEALPCTDDLTEPAPAKRPATYQDVLDAPPNKVAEVLGGALYTSPRPASPHAGAASGLGATLGNPFQYGRGGPGGWWIIDEPELHLGDDIVVPDLAGWRHERMPEYPDVPYFSQAPDWICEVLSASTRTLDEGMKQAIYAREGVPHLWFAEPRERWLAAYALRGKRYALLRKLAGNASVSLPPFEAIAFNLGDLWLTTPR